MSENNVRIRRSYLKIMAILLLFGICFSLSGCRGDAEKTQGTPRRAREITEEMLLDYARHKDAARERVDALLKELTAADANLGYRWEKIMNFWMAQESSPAIRYDVLPDGLPDTEELCIVVLGFQLENDGAMKEELIGRLKVALKSAEKYPNAYVLCTGGGTARDNQNATEAEQMASWLSEHGVDEKRLIVENRSRSTAQNAIYSYDLLQWQYNKVKKLAMISSDYHIAGGTLLFFAQSILRAYTPDEENPEVIAHAAWKATEGEYPAVYQASALIELTGDLQSAERIRLQGTEIDPDTPSPAL